MSALVRVCLALAPALLMGGCFTNTFEDEAPLTTYFQRKDGVTLSAGNAAQANTVTHVIDPWPPYAGNRHIPGNGERMSGAVERYRDVSKLKNAPPPMTSPTATEAGGTPASQ